MKSFRSYISEEVLPTVQVPDGSLDISKPAVRAAINAAVAGVVSQPAVTPYVVFLRLSKLLAQYHIVLPKRFLEGDKGVEVFELKQFGHKMGMTDSGEFVHEVPATHYLFLQYGIITPMGVTYAKPLVGGMFRVTAKIVDKAELDRLLDMAEITMSEEAEVRQLAAKALAPKEDPHTALGDCDCSQGDSPSTKDAVKVSMKKKIEEDKDPCWKGYEMVGMKKKGGRKVPNCVPVKEEEQIDELSKKTLGSYVKKASVDLYGRGASRAFDVAKGKDPNTPQAKKAGKRISGIYKASDKLAKEEVESTGKKYNDNSHDVKDWSPQQLKWHRDKLTTSSAKAHSELKRRSKVGEPVKEEVEKGE